MDPLAHKVARRFLADIIGNPHQLLQKYDAAVERVSDMEPLLPKMREGQKIAERTPNAEWLAHKGELAPHENELVNLYFKNIYRVVVRVNLDTFHHAEAWSLFLAILQQYDLSPATRKPIEVASKFFARSRIQAPKKPVAIDTYETFLKTLRGFSLAARDALAHGKPRAGGASESNVAPDKVRAGPFTLINTGGFKDSVLADCAKVVEVAAHQLQSHGLGNVCYGDVLISNTLMKSNVLAFYLIQKDEMFVRANLRGKEGAAIQTVVHELGHRLMYKFLSSKHREIEHIYNTLKSKSSASRAEALIQLLKDPALKPKPGDTFVSKGEEFTVTGLDVNSRGVMVQLVTKAQPIVKARIPLEAYAAAKGTLPKINHSSFVTGYAGTDAAENFAEMVAYYCEGRLPADQVEMLKSVL